MDSYRAINSAKEISEFFELLQDGLRAKLVSHSIPDREEWERLEAFLELIRRDERMKPMNYLMRLIMEDKMDRIIVEAKEMGLYGEY